MPKPANPKFWSLPNADMDANSYMEPLEDVLDASIVIV